METAALCWTWLQLTSSFVPVLRTLPASVCFVEYALCSHWINYKHAVQKLKQQAERSLVLPIFSIILHINDANMIN